MSGDLLEPLPPELTALLELERQAHTVDPRLKTEVLDHVEMAITLAGPAGSLGAGGGSVVSDAAGVGASAGVKKLVGVGLAALAMGGAAGAASTALLLQRSEHPVASPTQTVVVDSPPPSATIVEIAASALPNAGGFSATSPPSAPIASHVSTPAPLARGDLAKERELLDVARAALARGRPADAIAAADEHARRWPRGYLGEEREVVLIQALAASGRRQDAEVKAAQFRMMFPKSMLMPAVDAALGGSP